MRLQLLVLLFAFAAPATAAPTVLNSCGETVDDAVLAADLDCSGTPGYAVFIAPGGRLSLAGHQLISGAVAWEESGAIQCLADCTIDGGGGSLVSNPPQSTLAGIRPWGVRSSFEGRNRVSISATSISGYAHGAYAQLLTLDSCILTENRSSVSAHRLSMSSSTITSVYSNTGGDVLGARRATISDCTFNGGSSLYTIRMDLIRSVVAGMQYDGVHSRKLYAEDSVIEGNCLTTLPVPCADIVTTSWSRPKLVNTTCSTSLRDPIRYEHASTWGVCSMD